MRQSKSNLLYAIPIALLLAIGLPAGTSFADDNDGWAEWFTDSDSDSTTMFFYNKDVKNLFLVVTVQNDGLVFEQTIDLEGGTDPNPDDPKGSTPPNVPGLIKHGKISYKVYVNLESSPLGKWINQSGHGFAPKGNPSNEDSGKGHGTVPVHSNEGPKKSMKEIVSLLKAQNRLVKQLDILQTSMGSGEEGGSESKPGVNPHGKSNGGNVNDRGDSKNHTIGKLESLGPKPELVNPPPKSREGKVGSLPAVQDSGKVVPGPGLLEGGGGFGAQGPAATGSPVAAPRR